MPRYYESYLFQRLRIGSSRSVRKCGKRHPQYKSKLIQKQEQMRQQIVEKGMKIIPRQDLPLVE